MATVTSFTAERMLQIENTTVVDGEVVGDNLHLLQRDGTPIDAGNVRGATGAPGPPGQNGADGVGIPVGGTTDQVLRKTSATDYAVGWKMPDYRIFTNKAALDGWTSAPNGAKGYTTTENRSWVKRSGIWTWDGPQGQLGYAQIVANAGPTGGPTLVNGLQVNGITVPSPRRIRVTFGCRAILYPSANIGGWVSIVHQGTEVSQWNAVGGTGASASGVYLPYHHTLDVGSSNNYAIYIVPPGGSNISIQALSYSPAFIMVEDIGDA